MNSDSTRLDLRNIAEDAVRPTSIRSPLKFRNVAYVVPGVFKREELR
jgi:hypothetical protein